MPWSRGPVDEREEMIRMYECGWRKSDLAEHFGVTWRCVHNWVKRHLADPELGLLERSRAPLTNPHQKSAAVVEELLALKRKFPLYGPCKLVTFLSEQSRMAASTAGEILKQHDLVRRRRPRRGAVQIERSPIVIPGAGHTMTADFKGHFRLTNGQYCYPLTIAEPVSRYVFAIDALTSTSGDPARVVFERVFREHGVPEQILTDNGSPFCAPASLGAISELSKWWIRLGILPVRIRLGRPQQNGVHERMHRTLKESSTRPPAATIRGQQRKFDEFRQEFNTIRPHQSLGQQPPVTHLEPYRREYTRRLRPLEYRSGMEVRRVRTNGEIRWRGELLYVSGVLAGENIAFERHDEWAWNIYFGPVLLGRYDERHKQVLRIRSVGKRAPQQGEERVPRPEGEGTV